MIEDYVQHLSQNKIKLVYNPELLLKLKFLPQLEFVHFYDLHPYATEEVLYSYQQVYDHGFAAFVNAMTTTLAGAMYWSSHGPATLQVIKELLDDGRKLRMKSLNNYRAKFGLDRYTDFIDMTGDASLAKQLEELYGHVDAVEWFAGTIVEKQTTSTVTTGSLYSIKGMLENPLSRQHSWKPSTFGGQVGFDIVKSASLKNLFCNNMKPGECQNIAFSLPKGKDKSKTEL